MNSLTKSLLTGTALLTSQALAAAPAVQPSTQPATRPAPVIAQSNAPLVIPDGTSPQNPGPQFQPAQQPIKYVGFGDDVDPNSFCVFGLRG